MEDFDEIADDSKSVSTDGSDSLKYCAEDGLNYSTENQDSDPTVAARVKVSKRKRTLPSKFLSPKKSAQKKGGKSVPKQLTVQENAAIEYEKKKGKKSVHEEAVTAKENAAIAYVNALWASKQEVVVFRNGKEIILSTDMTALTHPPGIEGTQKYLGIEIIDAYTVHILQPRVEDNRLMCPGHYSWMFSLTSSKNDTKLSETYLKGITMEIFRYEMVFFPVHLKQGLIEHWVVLVMRAEKKEFQILDSLQWKPNMYEEHIQKVIKGIEFVAKGLPNLPVDVSSWEVKPQKKHIATQTDGYSCGLFAIKFMELWNGTRLKQKFTQKDIPKFRKQVAAELIFLEANEAEAKEGAEKIMNSMDVEE